MVKEVLGRLQVGPEALFSTLGRVAARGIETVLLARRMNVWYDRLVDRIRNGDAQTFNGERWEPSSWPAKSQGYGYLDAPRGALGHWVQIENGKISRYQCVVPSTWNCSPRDAQGQMGPYEAALVDNHPLVRSRAAARDPAHHPLVRSLHGLRRPRAGRDGNRITEVRVQ